MAVIIPAEIIQDQPLKSVYPGGPIRELADVIANPTPAEQRQIEANPEKLEKYRHRAPIVRCDTCECCPHCASPDKKRIQYGYGTDGGCFVFENSAKWQCKQCGNWFGSVFRPDQSELLAEANAGDAESMIGLDLNAQERHNYDVALSWFQKASANGVVDGDFLAARLPNLTSELIEHLASHENDEVRGQIAERFYLSDSILEILARDSSDIVRGALAGNRSIPQPLLERLADDPAPSVRFAAAKNREIPDALFLAFADDDSEEIRKVVAARPITPGQILSHLAGDRGTEVRVAVAANSRTPAETLVKLSRDSKTAVRGGVVKNPNTPADVLAALADDREGFVRQAVASNPNTPTTALDQLAASASAPERAAVAANPSTPMHMIQVLADDADYSTSSAAAIRLPPKPILNRIIDRIFR